MPASRIPRRTDRRLDRPGTWLGGGWSTGIVAVALLIGLGLGTVLGQTKNPIAMSLLAALDTVGVLWINAIRMMVIPLIIPLLILAVASAEQASRVGALAIRTAVLFAVLLASCASAAALLGPWLFDALHFSAGATMAVRAHPSLPLPVAGVDLTVSGWLRALVPPNLFKALADGAILPMVLFSLAFGAATFRVESEDRARLLAAASSIKSVITVLIKAVLALAPIGVFALAAGLGASIGGSSFAALGAYVAVAIGVNLLILPPLYALAAWGGRVSWLGFARAVLPAQLIAISTRSSLASLPALITGARDVLRLRSEATDFVLPVAIATFKLTAAVSWTIGAIFIGRLYGIEVGPAKLATVVVAAVLLNATIPGIPNGAPLLLAPVFAVIGLPVEGIAILIAINPIPDIFQTLGNVTADLAVATVVSGRAGPNAVTPQQLGGLPTRRRRRPGTSPSSSAGP